MAAHTLEPDDLIYPTGELMAAQFPAEDLTANVTAWLDVAQTYLGDFDVDEATANKAAAQHVYARGYRAIAQRLASTPDKSTYSGPNTVTREHSTSRIAYWERKAAAADEALAKLLYSEPAHVSPQTTVITVRPTF